MSSTSCERSAAKQGGPSPACVPTAGAPHSCAAPRAGPETDWESGWFEIDWDRERRTGIPEAVLCASKSASQIEAILSAAADAGRRLLFTRLEPAVFAALDPDSRARLGNYDPVSRTAWCGPTVADADLKPGIGIVAAGTSDLPVAAEAARTLAFLGFQAPVIADVGVAGLWRLMRRLDEIRAHRVVIAVAGMEGALFSVLAGLIDAPVIAVPTSRRLWRFRRRDGGAPLRPGVLRARTC